MRGCRGQAYRQFLAYADTNSNSESNPNSNADSNSDCDSDTNGNAHSNRNPNSDADSSSRSDVSRGTAKQRLSAVPVHRLAELPSAEWLQDQRGWIASPGSRLAVCDRHFSARHRGRA